jgi:hypothetical protein|tara:strand:+ start:1403 stop:1771 length:369 start_codon:yes stop_codon:yes gene_type:complete
MATIPEEYANFDFGFSAVDDEEYKAKTTEVEKKIVEVEAKSKDFSALEKKIDSAIKEIGYKKDYLEEKYVEDMGKVEELILPILYNLMKNPEKDYIYWPKRESIITKQIEKIKDVTQDLSNK